MMAMRMAYLALIIIGQVLCMDEADEIYQLVNEGFSPQDHDLLMDILSSDVNLNDQFHEDGSVEPSGPMDLQDQIDHDQLNALDTDINEIGMEYKD